MKALVASLVALAVDAPTSDGVAPAHATFDTRLMRGARGEDIHRFERGDALAPGNHALDVVRNGLPVGRRTVRFAAGAAGPPVVPCFDRSLAGAIALDIAALSSPQRVALDDPAQCRPLSEFVPAARTAYDAERLALQVSVPQAALLARARDAIDPALREAGMPAFRATYALNATHHDSRHAGNDRSQASARIDLGANVAGWRWRHRSTHGWQSATHRSAARWRSQVVSSVVERDIDALEAQLTVGDFHTRGVLFDSIGLRGARLESDDRMQPPSLLRYAPVVRGVADTHARVQVRQGHVLLHDATVAPGPFALRDVQPLGFGGALEVRVIETDGRVSTFSVPYAAIPGLLRPGHARFGLAAGRWRDAPSDRHSPRASVATDLVIQGTVQRGVRDRLTVHGGAQLAHGYVHGLMGLAVATPVGAFSLDRAHSRWRRDARTMAGHALRLAYAGRVPGTGTTIDLAAARHGSDGYRVLADTRHAGAFARERLRLDASARQSLGRGGTLTLGWVERVFRDDLQARQRSLRLGWGMSVARHGLLQASLDRARGATPAQWTGTLSVSLPLAAGAGFLHAHARTTEDRATVHASASRAFGRDRRHGWALGATHASGGGAATTATATLSTRGRAGNAAAGLSATRDARHWSATAEGSVLLHPWGVTFGPPLGDTIALVRAPHAGGATLLQHPVVQLDRKGHAVVPHLSPYRRNSVGVSPRGASPDVRFDWTERNVVPRAGAVIDVAVPTCLVAQEPANARAAGTAIPTPCTE